MARGLKRWCRLRWLPLLLSLWWGGVWAEPAAIDDGPYVLQQSDGAWVAQWVCAGRVDSVRLAALPATLPQRCATPWPLSLQPVAAPATAVRFQAPAWVAVSDIHGQFEILWDLLRNNGVVDAQGQWAYGAGHLVVVGDVLDRGPRVTEALWLLYRLEAQARAAGGAVHVLLGNHEVMVLAQDLRYVHAKYQAVSAQFGMSYAALYGANSVLGAWLRSKPAMVVVNGHLFVHGGVHTGLLQRLTSVEAVNAAVRRGLGRDKAAVQADAELDAVLGRAGPLWFRGYFRPEVQSDQALQQVLDAWQLQRVVVGHTTFDAVYSHYQGRVVSVDSDIKSGRTGQLLMYRGGQLWRADRQGQQSVVPPWQPAP